MSSKILYENFFNVHCISFFIEVKSRNDHCRASTILLTSNTPYAINGAQIRTSLPWVICDGQSTAATLLHMLTKWIQYGRGTLAQLAPLSPAVAVMSSRYHPSSHKR
ncbi:unnamed protein product [Pieris brassicae]|uniref:Uncharacterized protein n=1 Tax=Pieris brassicae TaxID=7116 RepID=A0A9P0T3S9_PIEBR|nr:unnamed protein product [Pieris brassicae]